MGTLVILDSGVCEVMHVEVCLAGELLAAYWTAEILLTGMDLKMLAKIMLASEQLVAEGALELLNSGVTEVVHFAMTLPREALAANLTRETAGVAGVREAMLIIVILSGETLATLATLPVFGS